MPRAGRFEGLGTILLQPYDEDLDYTFEFEVASAADANDGAIPFGETLNGTPNGSKCEIRKHPERTDYSTEIIGAFSNTSAATEGVVTIPMSYPYVSTLTAGQVITDTIIVVGSTAGMVAGDRVGIMMDAVGAIPGIIHWDIIASITDATTFVTTDGMAGAAAIGNKVFVPRIVKGKYHLTIVCYFSGGGDKEFNYNRVFIRDI